MNNELIRIREAENLMKKINFTFLEILDEVKEKPADMAEYAKQQMERVSETLHDMPPYACPSSCSNCCHGSILMSYVEYINILLHLHDTDEDLLTHLFTSRLGVLEDDGKLLCPFVRDEKEKEHCAIYMERPLICRVFGTSASPCEEDIDHPKFPDELFYHAYNMLYYMSDGSFIGLPLTDNLVLYEAPFDIWAVADSGRTSELMDIFKEHGSMRSVLYDLVGNRFFTIIETGERHYISE